MAARSGYSDGPGPLAVMACAIGLIVIAMAVLGPMAMTETTEGLRNQTHADSKHIEAVEIRINVRSGACDSIEMWYSLVLGQVCLLCDMPGTDIVGGWIIRITEGGGKRILPESEIHEVTAYVGTRAHWDNKRIEGGYVLLSYYPAVRKVLNGALGLDL